MKHIHILIDISENLKDNTTEDYLHIQNGFVKYLIKKGYLSFEENLSNSIKQFLNIDIDLTDEDADPSSFEHVRRSMRIPTSSFYVRKIQIIYSSI